MLLGLRSLDLEHRVKLGLGLPVRVAHAVRPREVLRGEASVSVRASIKTKRTAARFGVVGRADTYLAVVHGEVEVVQGVVRGAVDDRRARVAGAHVRVVDENTPEVDSNEESEIEIPV